MSSFLEISDLSVSFPGMSTWFTAVENIHLSVKSGETLAIIGESGSGKSVLGLAILRLLPENVSIEGQVLFKEKNLLTIPDNQIESIRGNNIAWIPQNPKTSFNPSMKMWMQIAEPPVIHSGFSWLEAKKQVIKQFLHYHILPADKWAEEYPITYSGGMLQRATIAMGTSTQPDIIIADEPTKGIDSINKNDIIEMFAELKRKGITLILITHDLDFVSSLADRVAVLYCGQIVEIIEKSQFFNAPRHPYTLGLIKSLPQNGLDPIPGSAPPMHQRVTGCRFRERCLRQNKECTKKIPLFSQDQDYVRCINYDSRNRII